MWGACATLPLLREGPALSAHFLEQKEGSKSEKCSSRLTQGSGLPMWFPKEKKKGFMLPNMTLTAPRVLVL